MNNLFGIKGIQAERFCDMVALNDFLMDYDGLIISAIGVGDSIVVFYQEVEE